MEKVVDVAYKLELPEELSRVHNTFHVSNLKKCHTDEPLAVLLDGLHVDDKLHFVTEPVEIVDREVKWLKQIRIPLVKVRWNSKQCPEFTWEREDQFRKKDPHLFSKTALSSKARIVKTAIIQERAVSEGSERSIARECTYQDFMKCQPLFFKGTEGVVKLTRGLNGMGKLLTVGHEVVYAMTWTDLKKMMIDKYCPRSEIKKLEVELWNLKVKGTDVLGYNQRFQELALLCVRMFSEESDKI
ncbi:putative reverse transcriptase domain-containing protein [Tanacetum coccineum]